MNPTESGQIVRFRELIAQRLGLRFDDSKLGFLKDVLTQRTGGNLQACSGYLTALEGSVSEPELQLLVTELTVPETYFFRHVEQFRAYADVALPAAQVSRGPERPLQVLSVGCASGEEPYSLAMWARDHGGWRVEVTAFDINQSMLDKAIRGQYSTWALRETPAEVQQRWFHPAGGHFELNADIRNSVRFQRINLAHDHAEAWQPHRYDVIFCRNVLMYFHPATAQAAMARMTQALVPHGHLFLGHAETIRGLSVDYELCHSHETFYYQRKPPGAARQILPQPGFASPEVSSTDLPAPPNHTWPDTIRQSSDRIQALSRSSGRTVATRQAPSGLYRPTLAAQMHTAREFLQQERFADALLLLSNMPAETRSDPEVMLLRAALLTHSGQLPDAEHASAELLERDPANAGAHYLLALCRESVGDSQGALEHDAAAIHLDADFAMPRLHLGLMARRGGDWASARSALGEALPLLRREHAARVLLFGGGFGRDGLIALCAAELATSVARVAAS